MAPAAGAHLRAEAEAADGLPCTPQTRMHLPIGRSVTGDTVWSPPFYFTSGTPQPIGRHDVTQAKICGPGHFWFSPMSCDHITYRPDDFLVKTSEVTGECKVVDLPTVEVAGLACALIEC
uniref:Uncharacterized protein n=1 Tax=Alexandrium catenella TaxID=2925 RepID=A0A7S1WNY6_ALECA